MDFNLLFIQFLLMFSVGPAKVSGCRLILEQGTIKPETSYVLLVKIKQLLLDCKKIKKVILVVFDNTPLKYITSTILINL